MTDTPEQIADAAMEKAIGIAQLVLRNLPDDYGDMTLEISTIARALAAEREAATMAERERCAKIAETLRQYIKVDGEPLDYAATPEQVAAAIRAGE